MDYKSVQDIKRELLKSPRFLKGISIGKPFYKCMKMLRNYAWFYDVLIIMKG